MNARKIVASIQVVVGIAGLLVCGLVHMKYTPRVARSIEALDQLSGDAAAQAGVGQELLAQWSVLLGSFENSAATHSESLNSLSSTTRVVTKSLESWESGLLDLAEVARDGSRIAGKFGSQLPIRIPAVEYQTKQVVIEVPDISLQERTIRIPYPTASVGSKRVSVDLGLTEVKLDVPTLNVGTREKTVKVPTTPDVQRSVEKFVVPSKMEVTHREFLKDEKQLLEDTSRELLDTSAAMKLSATALADANRIVGGELPASIEATAESLQSGRELISDWRKNQIPQLQSKLGSEQAELTKAQETVQTLKPFVSWLLLVAALIPLSILMQGIYNHAVIRSNAAENGKNEYS